MISFSPQQIDDVTLATKKEFETVTTNTPDSSTLLLAGWAVRNITPEKPVQLQGQHYERISTHVNDPCLATALVLQSRAGDGNAEHALLVSCDLCMIPRELVERIRERLAERLPDIDPAKLIVHATHTHTGPVITSGRFAVRPDKTSTPDQNAALLIEQVTAAVVEAWEKRGPVRLSRALGHAAIGYNRRLVYADGSVRMYGKSNTPDFRSLEGAGDPGIEIFCLHDERNRLRLVAANVACPSQVIENKHFVSADFWGAARRLLRERHGDDVVLYGMTGAAGDQSPRDLVRRNRNEPNMHETDGMQEMGRRLVNAIDDALQHSLIPCTNPVALCHHVEELSLPARVVTAQDFQEAQEFLGQFEGKPEPESGSREATWIDQQRAVIKRFEEQGANPEYSFDLHVIRVGDLVIAGNPFELYLDYGFRIKARSAAGQTFLIQLAGDRGSYLPTEKAIAGGHYGAKIAHNKVGPPGGDQLVDTTVARIEQLFSK